MSEASLDTPDLHQDFRHNVSAVRLRHGTSQMTCAATKKRFRVTVLKFHIEIKYEKKKEIPQINKRLTQMCLKIIIKKKYI